MIQPVLNWLQRRADNVAVGLLTAIFLLFMLQIISRYVFKSPIGWTLEANLLAWLWLVFWSSAFILTDKDHVRFTMIVDHVRPGLRRVFVVMTAVFVVAALAIALLPTLDFVLFMKIEKTSLLKIRFDFVFSIYLIFSVAMIVRYIWRVVQIVRGQDDL